MRLDATLLKQIEQYEEPWADICSVGLGLDGVWGNQKTKQSKSNQKISFQSKSFWKKTQNRFRHQGLGCMPAGCPLRISNSNSNRPLLASKNRMGDSQVAKGSSPFGSRGSTNTGSALTSTLKSSTNLLRQTATSRYISQHKTKTLITSRRAYTSPLWFLTGPRPPLHRPLLMGHSSAA